MSLTKDVVIEVGIETGKAVLGVGKLVESFNVLNRVVGAALAPIKDQIQSIKDMIGWYTQWSLQIQAVYGQVSGLIGGIIKTKTAFENFKATLSTSLRSDAEAELWMRRIEKFAAVTPFSVQELTQAFTALSARGVTPTMEAMRKMGDFAAASGKPLEILYNAIGDATDPARWLNFGIKMHTVGDKMQLIYRGMTVEVARTTKGALQAVEAFGSMAGIAGGMEKKSLTLGGAISNLGDAWESLQNSLGTQMLPIFRFVIEKLQDLIKWSQLSVGGLKDWVSWLMTWLRWADENKSMLFGWLKVYTFYKIMIYAVIEAAQFLAVKLLFGATVWGIWWLWVNKGAMALSLFWSAVNYGQAALTSLSAALGINTASAYANAVAKERAAAAAALETTAENINTGSVTANSVATGRNTIFKTIASGINRAVAATTTFLAGTITFSTLALNGSTWALIRNNIFTTLASLLYYGLSVAVNIATGAITLFTRALFAAPFVMITLAVTAISAAWYIWGNAISETEQRMINFKNAITPVVDEMQLLANSIEDAIKNGERYGKFVEDLKLKTVFGTMHLQLQRSLVTQDVYDREMENIKDGALKVKDVVELAKKSQNEVVTKYNEDYAKMDKDRNWNLLGFSGGTYFEIHFDELLKQKEKELKIIQDDVNTAVTTFESAQRRSKLLVVDPKESARRDRSRKGYGSVIEHDILRLKDYAEAMYDEAAAIALVIEKLHDAVRVRKQLTEFGGRLIPLDTTTTELQKEYMLLDNKKKIAIMETEIKHRENIKQIQDKKETADMELQMEYGARQTAAFEKLKKMKVQLAYMQAHPPQGTKTQKPTQDELATYGKDVAKQIKEIDKQDTAISNYYADLVMRKRRNDEAFQVVSQKHDEELMENRQEAIRKDGEERLVLYYKINHAIFETQKQLNTDISGLEDEAAVRSLENTAFFANAGGLRINTDMALVKLQGQQRRKQISKDTDIELKHLYDQYKREQDALQDALDAKTITQETYDKAKRESLESYNKQNEAIIKKSQLQINADLEAQRREEDDIRRKRIKAAIDAVQTLSEGIFSILKANSDAEIALVNKSIERQQARIDKIKEALREGGDAARQYGAEQVAAEEDRLEKLKKLKEEEINRQQAYTEVQLFLNAALAISGVLASPLSTASAGILGIIQVGVILGTLFTSIAAAREGARGALAEKGGRPIDLYNQQRMLTGGMLTGPSHSNGGIALEAEGSEFIINKKMTAKYLPVLKEINAGKFSMIQHPKYNQEIMQTYTNNQNDYNFKRLENRLDEQNNILTAILKTSKSQKPKINIEVKNEKPYRPQ